MKTESNVQKKRIDFVVLQLLEFKFTFNRSMPIMNFPVLIIKRYNIWGALNETILYGILRTTGMYYVIVLICKCKTSISCNVTQNIRDIS